jgi:cytochrome d ubiquinol oxidase subunit I
MSLDPVLLSRIQFAFTVSFHIIFPSFSIGLATFLLIMETCWLKTKKVIYYNICRFYTKIFALTFGMGVVSGIVMEFQFGTNWPGFASHVGPVLGALFVYEVLTAFFIEAGFLGVMIFGWDRISPKLHYVATWLVAIGVNLSAFWIMSANSWMQTPAGAHMDKHHFFHVDSWAHVIMNPLLMPRFTHMLLSAYITTGLMILGISAYFILGKTHALIGKVCAKTVLVILIILIPLQVFMGDKVGRNVLHYQPIKTAAIESVWHTQAGAPLLLFAYPNMHLEKNQWPIAIPKLASLINTHHWNGVLPGLTSVPSNDRPFVPIVFYSFRIMVGMGIIMLLLAIVGVLLMIGKRLERTDWYLKCCMICAPIGFIAIITGWFTAETGRQPWAVYHYLRTKDVATHVAGHTVFTSLVLLILVYGLIFGVFYMKYLLKAIKHGPVNYDDKDAPFAYMQGSSHNQLNAKQE